MGQVTFHSDAKKELGHAIAYYEDCRAGLGMAFRDEVIAFLSKISDNPETYSVRKLGVRRANLKRFPFNINYYTRGDDSHIVAISHNR